jgi:GNAT superfamily N-acetyltransferase
MSFNVRRASLADVSEMHRLRLAVRENRLSESTAISEASYSPFVKAGTAWVAEAEDRIVGFAALDASNCRVWALFVLPQHEGRGIGRSLLETMLRWAAGHGIRHLALGTEQGSRAAGFYQRAGWRQIGTTADGEALFETSLPT